MAVDASTPVTAIEGIGPALARDLARIRVHTVFDLLRCTPDQMRRAASYLSFADAYALRAAASLLQVRGMTGQWAEALVKGGVKSIDELQGKWSPEVYSLLRRARRRRLIRALPTPALLERILRDAVLLRNTGTLVGTVRDAHGKAVRGAQVAIGRQEQRTDARGRVHLLRLPLGRALELRITHPRFDDLVIEKPRILLDSDLVAVQIFTLKRRRRVGGRAASRGLSELAGDTLPTPTGQPFRVEPMSADRIPRGDLLMVQNIPAKGDRVKLVSRFKSFVDGQFVVRTVAVPRSRLPAELNERDHVRFDHGEFQSVRVDPPTIRKEIALRAMRTALPGRMTVRTAAQRRRAVATRVQFLIQRGFFSGTMH